MYPCECDSQEDRDRKAESMPLDEFEIVFDAVLWISQHEKAEINVS
jgi:hypothetical protein